MDHTVREETPFRIKGHREGLLIAFTESALQENDWSVLSNDLLEHIHARQNFFKGARVALDVGHRSLSIADISSLRDRLSDYEVTLWALQTADERTTQSVRNLGLSTSLPSSKNEQKIKPIDTLVVGEEAFFVRKTLRSGFRIVYEGHVIVMGDVNPGAEIIAGGSVVVWGRLRGSVHAGAQGDEEAVVCAMEMKPTQVRIASVVGGAPPNKRGKPQPEICTVRNGQIVIEGWRA